MRLSFCSLRRFTSRRLCRRRPCTLSLAQIVVWVRRVFSQYPDSLRRGRPLTSLLPGLAFVRLLATRPDVIVYSTARKLEGATELRALADESGGKVRLLELSYGDEASNEAAAARVKSEVGRLDVVIANAGNTLRFGYLFLGRANVRLSQASSIILVRWLICLCRRCASIWR